MKPYVRLAYGLILAGTALFMLERYGLDRLHGTDGVHLAPTLWTALVLAPIALIVGGCLVFMVGRIRRL
jgi:hypothetical protein